MKPSVSKIQKLLKFLPQKDIPLGEKFIEKRQFEALKDLVNSALVKAKMSQESDNPKEEYSNVNLNELMYLKTEVDNYVILLDISTTSSYDYFDEDFDNYGY